MEADFDKDILRNAKTDQISFVLALRDAVGGGNVLGTLLSTSRQQWGRFTDIHTGDHLIKGVGVSTVKTDACYTYIAHLIKQYMVSAGVRATAWTQNTIASENFTNKAISNIIAARTFDEHTELFKIVATRLMGFDDTLVDMALTSDGFKKAEHLVVYMGSRFNMSQEREELLSRYGFEVGYLQALFDTGGFTPEFFERKVSQAISHWDNEPTDDEPRILDHFKLLTQE
jgi:hypothetical protein